MLHHRYLNRRNRPTSFGIGMADLAFVVLAFFVLTIVPDDEAGFLMKLEPWWSFDPPESYRVKQRNILSIGTTLDNEIWVNGEVTSFDTIKAMVIAFISNPNKSPELAESPRQAKIFFGYERWTKYADFISVIESVKSAYWELWEKEAIAKYKRPYHQLSKSERQGIRKIIPFTFEVEAISYCGW